MSQERFFKKYIDWIIPVCIGILGWIAIALLFDFYYDLNDDVAIKDIISGVYTGLPDAHNNQMMYPISAILALLYRISGVRIPWFGLFEMFCFFVSFVLIGRCIMKYVQKNILKIVLILIQTIIWGGCYLWELANIQYTVVCGMLVTAAAVWMYTTPEAAVRTDTPEDTGKNGSIAAWFLRQNIISMVLCIIAFNIRSEMFLLFCPLLAMVGIIKWSEEDRWHAADTFKKYLCFIGVIAIGVAATFAIDFAAYSSDAWQEFRAFFDARTEVYDITGIPNYNDNEVFYELSGVSLQNYQSLVSYNFGLDDDVTTEMLESIADYVKSGRAETTRPVKTIATSVREYISNAVNFDKAVPDMTTIFADEYSQHVPMNMIVLLGYVCLFMMLFYSGDKRLWLKIPVVVLLRSIPWIYVYSTSRVVVRLTHPMYMFEIMIVFVMIVKATSQMRLKAIKGLAPIAGIFAVIFCVINLTSLISEIAEKQTFREDINATASEVYTEAGDNPDTLYLLDVYSTVDFTEKIFSEQCSKKNIRLAGGWTWSMPLKEDADYGKTCFARLNEYNEWEYSEIRK